MPTDHRNPARDASQNPASSAVPSRASNPARDTSQNPAPSATQVVDDSDRAASSTGQVTKPSSPLPPPILSLRGVCKKFGSVRALDHVDFDIRAHEVVAVVGDNAAGKSVLAKTIAGVHPPDSGTIYLDGRPTLIPTPAAAHELGVATVFQDLALCDNLDIVANLFLGREARAYGVMKEAAMEDIARSVFGRIGARLPSVRTKVAALSGGQRQSTAVARALLGSPRIVVLDEPTSSLSVTQTAEVLNLIEHLRDLGYGVMLISHILADVQAVADRLVVMRHGRINGEAPMADVSYEDIIAAITGVPNDLTRATQRRADAARAG